MIKYIYQAELNYFQQYLLPLSSTKITQFSTSNELSQNFRTQGLITNTPRQNSNQRQACYDKNQVKEQQKHNVSYNNFNIINRTSNDRNNKKEKGKYSLLFMNLDLSYGNIQISRIFKALQQQAVIMSNWFAKNQCTANIPKLKAFYTQVLDQFIEKLFKQNRYRNQSNLDQKNIDDIKKKTKEKLANPAVLFERGREMKQGTAKIEEIIKRQNAASAIIQLKIQHNQDKDQYVSVAPNNEVVKSDKNIKDKEIQKSKKQGVLNLDSQKHIEEKEGEDDDDNFNEFDILTKQVGVSLPKKVSTSKIEKGNEVEGEIKKQQTFNKYIGSQKQIKIQYDDYSSSQDNDYLTIEECQANLSSIIMGTFNANTLKHKPKQQKTTITLDNVFVKWQSGQTFVLSVNMETIKEEKEQIRKTFPKRHPK